MARGVSQVVLITIWVSTLSRGCAPNAERSSTDICEGRHQLEYPPEDAALALEHKHSRESFTELVYFHRDATVCVERPRPFFTSLFQVRFEPGSATLDASELPPEDCERREDSLSDRQLAKCRRRVELDFEIDKARANRPSKPPTLMVRGYAWPTETRCEAEAVELSRRRAEAVADWLGSLEKYDLRLKVVAHGTKATSGTGGFAPRVVGVDLGPQPLVARTGVGPPLDGDMLSGLEQVVSDYIEPHESNPREYRLMDTSAPIFPYGCAADSDDSCDSSVDRSKQSPRRSNYPRRTGEDALIDWVHNHTQV